uniref:Ankyrin repeat protein n=1 Tax=viral metagenome TaxID=1070528 RepID=A0A6C0AE21_9ZZZZ
MESLFAEDICYWAVRKNQLNFLINLKDCGWEIKVNCIFALKNLDILKFLYKSGCEVNKNTLFHALNEDIEILKYVHEIFGKPKILFYEKYGISLNSLVFGMDCSNYRKIYFDILNFYL